MARETAVPEGASFAYDVGVQAIAEQLHRIEALDSKAGILIAADGVLAGLLFGGDTLLQQIPPLVAALGLGGVIMSLLLALLAFLNREYRSAPSLSAAIKLMAAPREWLQWRLLGNLERAFETNRVRLVWKSRLLTGSMLTLLITVALLGGYSVPTLIGGS